MLRYEVFVVRNGYGLFKTLTDEELSLPIGPAITKDELMYVIKTMNEFNS